MDTIQLAQETEYRFPYHHLPTITKGQFSQTQTLFWGYIYLSYIEHILQHIQKMSGIESVLDVGCGDGRLLLEIRKQFPRHRLVGVDYSERVLSFAQAFSFGKDIDFKCGDINAMDTLGSFSLITLIEVCEHIPPADLPVFLKSCFEHLAPHGTMLITVPSDITKPTHKHYQHFSVKALKVLVEPYATVECVEYLTKLGFIPAIIRRLFSNRFFILNERHLLNGLYTFYKKHFTIATASTGDRILMIVRKR